MKPVKKPGNASPALASSPRRCDLFEHYCRDRLFEWVFSAAMPVLALQIYFWPKTFEGSAFYLMDQRDKARQIWLKVLEINPNNKVVGDFLRRVGQ